ncbi:hypothetical protein ND436_002675 [Neisseria gonorrhoeae]|nr:hypothetical protein [Neisseria gonorrhoeae]UYP52450.1 hypothetical protein ND436_002675 [Neisseria gonorrhoeae]
MRVISLSVRWGGFIEPVSAVKEQYAVKVGGTALAYGRDYTVTDRAFWFSTRRNRQRSHGRAALSA